MQFIKKWRRGAESCRITWNHADIKLKFVLYPMVHIASAAFYERISEDLKRCDFILYEGVDWRKSKRRHHLYDLAARNLGLAAQENKLIFPQNAKAVNIDMPSQEFRTRFEHIPFRYRLLLLFLRPILWGITKVPAIKAEIKKHLIVWNDHRHVYNEEDELEKLICTERDKCIVTNIDHFFHDHIHCEKTSFVAVVFGAAHMPAISHCLRRLGFRPGTRKWIEMVHIDPAK